MPQYTFDHVHLRSPDPEATAAWFEDKLGAQVIRSVQAGRARLDMKVGGQNVFIIKADDTAAAPPSAPYQGIDHFGLSVVGLDEAVAGLKAKGVQFTMEPTSPRPGIRICFIRGPENISIELLERKPV